MQPIAKFRKQLFAIGAAMLFTAFAVFSLTGKINSSIDTYELYDPSS